MRRERRMVGVLYVVHAHLVQDASWLKRTRCSLHALVGCVRGLQQRHDLRHGEREL